ncbi:MAG: DUF5990 family protein [Armatimonadota bacterium]
MPTLRITLVDPPEEFLGYGKIRHQLQLKKGYLQPSSPNVYETEFELVEGVPKGQIVHYHGDKRRFIYIQWVGAHGQMFRRIKLYFEHFLEDDKENYDLRIAGTMKDGSPACSTARLIP